MRKHALGGRSLPPTARRLVSFVVAFIACLGTGLVASGTAAATSSSVNFGTMLPFPSLAKGEHYDGSDVFYGEEGNWDYNGKRRIKFTVDNKHTTNLSYNYYYNTDIYEATQIPAHTPRSSYKFTQRHPAEFQDDIIVKVYGRNQGNNTMTSMSAEVFL